MREYQFFEAITKNNYFCIKCANKTRNTNTYYFFYNCQKKNLIFEGKLDEENQSTVELG
jgi:hypothetical protein